MKPKAIFLLGPTASGKTALAMALADRYPVELISVDSALVYRGMNIGTAKPDAATLAKYPHHLIDLIDPDAAYSAALFRRDALAAMGEIVARGNSPLLVGGTMLYARALLMGLSAMPAADASVRAMLEEKAKREGWPALHAELARVDPVTAARLPPGDSQRIQRALEVYELTGKPISSMQTRTEDSADFPYEPLLLGLIPSQRSVLHDRIAVRFDEMIRQGLVDEVVGLRKQYTLNADMPSMRCVGYRQVWARLEGECDDAAMREQGIAATRQLAKRQMTWLRSMTGVEVFDCLSGDLAGGVGERVGEFLG